MALQPKVIKRTVFMARRVAWHAILLDIVSTNDRLLALFFGCITACGGDLDEARRAQEETEAFVSVTERVEEDWAHELRRAIEFGSLERARTLLEEHSEALGVESDLLLARLLTAEGEDLEAQRAIERARRAAPEDVRVPGTACELHSAHGRTGSALEELKRSHELGGASAEVHRAKGIHLLSRFGRAAEGLRHLEQARETDPKLPFLDRALAQAHLLLAKEHMGANRMVDAQRSVELSLHHDPMEFETRRLLSDIFLGRKRVEDALVVLEELHAEGHPVVGELASMEKRAALVKLLRGEREDALDLFCSARSHGLGNSELGSGAQILADAALAEIAGGVEVYGAGDLDQARRRFERAVELEPEILAGHNHLGVVCFRLGDDEAAIRHWSRVWEVALGEELSLPEAVEVNLARAMVRAGEEEAALAVLEKSLAAFPQGPHVEAVRGFRDELRE